MSLEMFMDDGTHLKRDITRWGLVEECCFIGQTPDGDYVLHADHLTALAAKDEQIRGLREALKLMLSPVTHLSGCLWLKNKTMPCQCGFNDRINSAVAAARNALSGAPEGEQP